MITNEGPVAPSRAATNVTLNICRFGGNQAERDAKTASGTAAAASASSSKGAAAPTAPGGDKKVAVQAGAGKKAAAAVPAAKKEPEGPPDVSRLDIRVRGRGGGGRVVMCTPCH